VKAELFSAIAAPVGVLFKRPAEGGHGVDDSIQAVFFKVCGRSNAE